MRNIPFWAPESRLDTRTTDTLVKPPTTAPGSSESSSYGEIRHVQNLTAIRFLSSAHPNVCPNPRRRGLGGRHGVRYCVRVAQRSTPGR